MGQARSILKKTQPAPPQPQPPQPPADQTKTSSKDSSKTVTSDGSAKEGTTEDVSSTVVSPPPSRREIVAKKSPPPLIAPGRKHVKNSSERQTFLKDGVKIVKQFENGRLVFHSVDGVPQELPKSKESIRSQKKIGGRKQHAANGSSSSSSSTSSSSSSPSLKRAVSRHSKRSLDRKAMARCKSMEGPKAGRTTAPYPPFFSTRCLPRHPAASSEAWEATARREFRKPAPPSGYRVAKRP